MGRDFWPGRQVGVSRSGCIRPARLFVRPLLSQGAENCDDDLAILKLYCLSKPLVIEEVFPLQADIGTTEQFIRRSRPDADGWISFFWGKTPEEYDKEPGIKAALTGSWLRHFSALRGEMLGGIPQGLNHSTRQKTHLIELKPIGGRFGNFRRTTDLGLKLPARLADLFTKERNLKTNDRAIGKIDGLVGCSGCDADDPSRSLQE